jgi:hypothetical protein
MKLMIFHVLNTIHLVVEAVLLLSVAATGLLAAFVQLQVVYQVPNTFAALMDILFVILVTLGVHVDNSNASFNVIETNK